MIDNLILGMTHVLLLITAWRLINRPDLDDESVPPPSVADRQGKGRWGRPRA